MDHPFTEQCFYSNCLSCQTNITIINLHTFVLDKVRVRELCCPLISHKLMIKSHACVVQENTHTQEGFTGLIPLPSPPLWKFKIRCIELTFALTLKLSKTCERVFIRYPNTLKMIQQNWAVPLLSNPNTLSLLLLIYFDFYMQFTTWGSCSSWWPYFVWESCFSCTLFQNGGKLFFHPMITGPKSILST